MKQRLSWIVALVIAAFTAASSEAAQVRVEFFGLASDGGAFNSPPDTYSGFVAFDDSSLAEGLNAGLDPDFESDLSFVFNGVELFDETTASLEGVFIVGGAFDGFRIGADVNGTNFGTTVLPDFLLVVSGITGTPAAGSAAVQLDASSPRFRLETPELIITIAAVPLPATLPLALVALAAFGLVRSSGSRSHGSARYSAA